MVSDSASAGHSSKAVMDSVVVTNASQDLAPLARTDARVFLLYSTHEEAKHILQEVRSVLQQILTHPYYCPYLQDPHNELRMREASEYKYS